MKLRRGGVRCFLRRGTVVSSGINHTDKVMMLINNLFPSIHAASSLRRRPRPAHFIGNENREAHIVLRFEFTPF